MNNNKKLLTSCRNKEKRIEKNKNKTQNTTKKEKKRGKNTLNCTPKYANRQLCVTED